jgi:hypothetical protein
MALAACGGGDDEEDATALLDKAFKNPIGSATVSLDTELSIEGVEQLSDPIQVKLNGPYKSNGDNKVPSFDFDISGSLGGQSGAFKFISTGDNAFVGFQGTNYELGEERISQANDQAGGAEGNRSLADLGLEPRDWVKDAKSEGDEDVAGTETTRVSGTFDVAAFLRDLNEVASSEEFGGQAPAQLTDEQIEQFTNAVKDPRFDIYVGKDDEKLHRLSADLEFEVPEAQRAQLNGASGGKLTFSVELSEIGTEVTVAAPENVRPIEDLTEQLGGLGSLGGLGGSSGGSGSGESPPPGGAAPGTPGTTPGAEAFEAYSQCLEQADPSDTDAIQECADLLR